MGGDDVGLLVSVNVGRPRTLRWDGREVTTAILKRPVEGSRRVEGVNIAGDRQADRRIHGGADKAVYAYAAEDYRWWEAELGRELGPGAFGENLTTGSLDLGTAVIGQRWRIGDVVLRVTQPRTPCHKLGLAMDDPSFPARFVRAGRPGTYLALEEAGSLAAGDDIRVLSSPGHGLTVAEVARALRGDPDPLPRMLVVPDLPDDLRAWARRRDRDRGAAGS